MRGDRVLPLLHGAHLVPRTWPSKAICDGISNGSFEFVHHREVRPAAEFKTKNPANKKLAGPFVVTYLSARRRAGNKLGCQYRATTGAAAP
jgi:hypothetical protein